MSKTSVHKVLVSACLLGHLCSLRYDGPGFSQWGSKA